MKSLADLIVSEIRANGPMDLGAFMGHALGHPQYGYYMTRDPFGQGGDFVTAPEISQIFGELIGAWAADLWMRMGQPTPFILAEGGPGRGTLMADALRATRGVPGFHEAAHVHLLETSPVLRKAQAKMLKAWSPQWHDDIDGLFGASDGPVIFLANELMDALPVRQLVFIGGQWRERVVKLSIGRTLCIGTADADTDLIALIPPLLRKQAVEGDIFEVAPARTALMTQLARGIMARGGAALIIDYGHTEPGLGETLQAVKAHEYVSVLHDPGSVDLTSHVDFHALAAAAKAADCKVFGPVIQGDFLASLGIGARAASLIKASGTMPDLADQIADGVGRLIMPEHMGALFKVMAITATAEPAPAGFHREAGNV